MVRADGLLLGKKIDKYSHIKCLFAVTDEIWDSPGLGYKSAVNTVRAVNHHQFRTTF